MRTWLLLVFLLVSDLSPPGEGGRASDHHRRASGRRLLLMTPLLEIRESQSKHQCVWRNVCVCVAVRRRLRTSPFYWTHTLHDGSRCTLSHQEFTGIIQRNHRTARVVSLLRGKGVAVFLRSDTDVITGRPDPRTLRPVLNQTKSWASGNSLLKKRLCAASVIISSKMRPAMNIEEMPKERIAQPRRRRREGARRPMETKVHTKYDRQAAVRRHQAATLTSGSPARKTPHVSQFHSQRTLQKHEHFNFNLVPKGAQKPDPSKAASGVNAEEQLLVVSRGDAGSFRRPQSQKAASRGGDKADVNGDAIPQRARRRERERTHIDGNGNQRRLARVVHEAGNNDGDGKQVSAEAEGEVFITSFLPDAGWETRTEPWSCPSAGTVKTTVKLLYRHPPTAEVIKTRFIMEPGSLKGILFSLGVHVPGGTERIVLKAAERRAKVTTVSPGGHMGINPTKQAPPEGSVRPSPPTLKAAETTASSRDAGGPASAETPRTAEARAGAEPGAAKCMAADKGAPTPSPFSGLRMREDAPAETTNPGGETEGRPASNRKALHDDPEENSVAFDTIHKTGEDNAPCCGGLVHRSQADGPVETARDRLLDEDEDEHFYYFDGVLRRVRNNLYPRQEKERRRKGSRGDSENSVLGVRDEGDTKENFLRYIRRLTPGNKAGHLK